jgi:formylglycine-generating enzyme required for sulfatase activity
MRGGKVVKGQKPVILIGILLLCYPLISHSMEVFRAEIKVRGDKIIMEIMEVIGTVIKVQGDEITIDLGSTHGIKVGMEGEIFYIARIKGKEIREKKITVALVRVTEVERDSCIAKVVEKGGYPVKGYKASFDLPITITGRDGAPMVLIPAGEFQMGDHFNEGSSDELPVHTVYLDAFYIDKYEVTNELYAKFLNEYGRNEDEEGHQLLDVSNPYCLIEFVDGRYRPKAGYEKHPVVEVSWWGAMAYARFYGKRLPTEAEWEKAARGGLVGKRYPWGDEISHDMANYDGTGGRDRWDGTAPVGSFPPNGYGLYDMAGNVWEWCADWYDENYYSRSPRRNPRGPDSGGDRVVRGGSWLSNPNNLRAAYRNYCRDPLLTYYNVGFRCAQDVTP